MILFMLAATVATHAAGAAPPPLSPRAQTLISPVHQAYERVETEQSKLPAPTTTSEKLERLLDLDQAGREAAVHVDLSSLPMAERQKANGAMGSEIIRHDLDDQTTLKSLLPPDGWFRRSIYGEKATQAAFLIVQHAVNDPELMRKTLTKLQQYTQIGEAKGGDYALMYDRVALEFDHKPQRYGSQVSCTAGKWGPMNLEDPAHVDQRRKAIGLSTTEAEYLKNFTTFPCN